MNLRNIMKKPDPIAPEPQLIRAGHERDAPAPRTRRRPQPVYPPEPDPAKVRQMDDLWDEQPKRRRVVDVEKPDRDYYKLALTVLVLFFGIGGIAIGAILMTQPGTPNNLAWLHGENAVVLICVVLLMLRQK